jgi:hypothetical protein
LDFCLPFSSGLSFRVKSKFVNRQTKINVAEGVRFELTRPFGLPVFKTGAINRSATPPGQFCAAIIAVLLHRSITPVERLDT